MPTYVVYKYVKYVRPSSSKMDRWEYTYSSKWQVDEAWPDGDINTGIHPEPWSWKQEMDEPCAKSRNEYVEGWSVYVDLPESDTIRALELGMAKINKAMGLLPEKKIEDNTRKLVNYK